MKRGAMNLQERRRDILEGERGRVILEGGLKEERDGRNAVI